MAVEELLQYVHPDAVYRRVPLADDQNALGPWREALKHYVPPDDNDPLWGKLVYGAGMEGTPVAFPSGPEGDRLWALLDHNQRALELLDEGIRRGRLLIQHFASFGLEYLCLCHAQKYRTTLEATRKLLAERVTVYRGLSQF